MKYTKYQRDVIFNHLCCDGIIQNYTKWVWHDEVTKKRPASYRVEVDGFMNYSLDDMIHDIGVNAFKKIYVEETLQRDMEVVIFRMQNFYKIVSHVKTI